jgi:cell division protease FtsH
LSESEPEKRAAVPGLAERAKAWLRRWRRERATRRKGGGGRLVWVLCASLVSLLAVFGWSLNFLYSAPASGQVLSLDEVTALADQGRLSSAVFQDADNRVVGDFETFPVAVPSPAPAEPVPPPAPVFKPNPRFAPGSVVNAPAEAGSYVFAVPSNGQAFSSLVTLFKQQGVSYTVDAQPAKQVVKVVSTFLLPLMVLANLFGLLFSLGRGSGSAIGEVTTFGTIGKGKASKRQTTISFEDVGGADEAVAELREVRDYLTDPGKYEALGAAPPKGVLLFGPPGTGKTLLAKAVAGEAGVPFFSVAGAEFVESLVGVGAARVRDLFARVRASAPAIVFIDELDAAGRKRGSGGSGGGSDEREQTLNQLLVEMDGFEVSAGIVVMGATNRPDILDPALMRPGRFDRHITIERPEVDGRLHILKIHAGGKPLGPDVDLELIARRTPGFTGADLASVVNEATLLTIREGRALVTGHDFEEAIQRVLSGPKRRGRVLTEQERLRTAYHEAGHVIVAAATGRADEVHRVSILARGRAVASVQMNAEAEATLLSAGELRAKLVTLLAGTAAESLKFGETSTGGEQDIEQATDLARDLVARYGMNEQLGPVRLLAKASESFLGNDIPFAEVAADTLSMIDAEICELLRDAQTRATALLARHRPTLDALAARLLEDETLEGQALAQVLAPIETEMAADSISTTSPSRNGRAPRQRTSRARAGAR